MAAGEDRARPSGASGTRGGTRGRRRRFLLNERGTVEGAHRKSGRRAGPAAVSAAGPGRGAERGELGLGAGEGPGAWRGSRGSRGPWGPGIGAPASRRRVPAAARGPGARAQRECRGEEDSVWMAGTLLSLRRSAVLGSGPRAVANLCDPYSIPLGFSLVVCGMGRIISD